MSVIGLLVNSTIKMSLVILLALGVMGLFRNRSAALRHWVLAVVVGCAAAIPALGAIRPSSSLLGQPAGSIQGIEQTQQPATPSQMSAAISAPARIDATTQTGPSNWLGLERISSLLVTIWLAGLVVSLFVLLSGLGRLTWLAARSRHVTTGRWSGLTSEIAAAYGLRRFPLLLQSDHPSLLVTWGFAAPKVILPAAASEWPEDRARVVLWHELAHIRRGDWLVQMVVELLRAIYCSIRFCGSCPDASASKASMPATMK